MPRAVVVALILGVLGVAGIAFVVLSSDDPEDEPADDSGGDTSGDDLAQLREQKAPELSDPAADHWCDAVGEPCSWAEVDPAVLAASNAKLVEVTAMFDDDPATSTADELAAIEEALLRDESVDMVHLDPANLTALDFRLEGGISVVVFSELASPRSGAAPASGAGGAVADDTDTDTDVDEEGSGPGFGLTPVSFEVTREPALTARRALVVSPFNDFDGADEASAVGAALGSHPDITVVPVLDDDVTPDSLFAWAGADAVHIATHGSTRCVSDSFGGQRCHSRLALGPMPAGATPEMFFTTGTVDGDDRVRWVVREDFFTGALSDAVVFLSACETAGNVDRGASTRLAGLFGAGLGWDHVVWGSNTSDSAVRFWTLAAEHGLDAKFAYDRLVEEDLDNGDIRPDALAHLTDIGFATLRSRATLQFAGDEKRIRDVVDSAVGEDKIVAESVIATEGTLEDGLEDVIERLDFEVEGVAHGTEASVRIRVLVDGQAIEPDFDLSEGFEEVDEDGWSDWRTVEQDVQLPFDLTRADVDPRSPRPHTWEVRVSDDGFTTYSATKADPVYFSAMLEAKGPLPTWTALGNGLPAGGELAGNELTIRFDTEGEDLVDGDFRAELKAAGVAVGYWDLTLEGTYDPETGTMSGTFDAEAADNFGLNPADSAGGVWEATVDVAAGTVTGGLQIGDRTEPFTAQIVLGG